MIANEVCSALMDGPGNDGVNVSVVILFTSCQTRVVIHYRYVVFPTEAPRTVVSVCSPPSLFTLAPAASSTGRLVVSRSFTRWQHRLVK